MELSPMYSSSMPQQDMIPVATMTTPEVGTLMPVDEMSFQSASVDNCTIMTFVKKYFLDVLTIILLIIAVIIVVRVVKKYRAKRAQKEKDNE